jgi:thiaminase/transcriptional activator TenA
VSPARFAELKKIFNDATRLEIDFWQMGLDRAD